MAKKKESLTPRDWLKRIHRAKKFRDQVKDKQNWTRILDEYKGEYRINNQSIKSPPINIIYGYVQTAIARIYFRDPHITVNPRGGSFIERAKLLEIVINFLLGEINLKREVEKLLTDAYLVGHGWLKFGYQSEIGESEGETPEQKNEYIKSEDIFVSYVAWEDIVFDVTLCKDPPYDCRWIAHRIIRPLEDIKKDTKYKNTSGLKENISVRDARGEKVEEAYKDSDLSLLEFWEIWDVDTNKIYVVAEGTDKFLRETENEYEMKGLPFGMLKFNKIPGEPYPMSDCSIIEPQVLERIKLRAAQINHIKRWARQLSIEKGAMTKEEMEKFAQGIDGAVTQREKGANPPVPIQYAPMQEEIFQLDALIQQDMDMVIGQTDTDRGGQAKTRTKTKYELQQQENSTSTRQAKRQDTLEDFLEEVATKIIALLKQYQTSERYVRISGYTPQEMAQAFPGIKQDATGIYFTKDDIQGEYDVEAKAGSTLPMNHQTKLQAIQAILPILPALGIQPGSPVSVEIAKEIFRELELKGVEKAYQEQLQQAMIPKPPMPQMNGPMPAPGPIPVGIPPVGRPILPRIQRPPVPRAPVTPVQQIPHTT